MKIFSESAQPRTTLFKKTKMSSFLKDDVGDDDDYYDDWYDEGYDDCDLSASMELYMARDTQSRSQSASLEEIARAKLIRPNISIANRNNTIDSLKIQQPKSAKANVSSKDVDDCRRKQQDEISELCKTFGDSISSSKVESTNNEFKTITVIVELKELHCMLLACCNLCDSCEKSQTTSINIGSIYIFLPQLYPNTDNNESMVLDLVPSASSSSSPPSVAHMFSELLHDCVAVLQRLHQTMRGEPFLAKLVSEIIETGHRVRTQVEFRSRLVSELSEKPIKLQARTDSVQLVPLDSTADYG
jgi:hypothetical protein